MGNVGFPRSHLESRNVDNRFCLIYCGKCEIRGNKMKSLIYVIPAILLLSGCARSIADINTSNADKSCVRQCTMAYSSSISGPFVSAMSMNRAADSYEVCVKTCTDK